MTRCFTLLCALIFSAQLFSQIVPQDDDCAVKCNRMNVHSREPEAASYYQYPSMDNYDIKYLKLELNVEAGDDYISGRSLTRAIALNTLDSFNIEFRDGMTIDSVYINGSRRNFDRSADHIFVPLSPALPTGATVSALFFFRGSPSNGVYNGTTGGGLTYTATLSESFQAREWFPSKQILRDKIDSADIWITTSAGFRAGSNGLLIAVVDSPNNKKQYQWKTRYPMNYYLPSFSVGNYLEYLNYAKPAAMAPDSILIQHYIHDDSGYFNAVKENLDKTPGFIETFSELFNLYPFKDEKYGHCHASIGGGMEHQTMSTMNSFGTGLIAHELGHQWWGDNVTCATWNHIWLNEGFARYCEYLAMEKRPEFYPTIDTTIFMQSIHDNVMSLPTGSVYVPDVSAYNEGRIFSSRLTYNKGGAVIHSLRYEIDDDTLFFKTLKNYQTQYKNSVATTDEFRAVAEATSGKSLGNFFDQWIYGEGFPTFNVTYIRLGTDSILLIINQTVSAPAITPFFGGLVQFTITSATGDTTVKAYLTANDQQFIFPYTKVPTGIIVDPNNHILNQTGNIINGGTVIPVQLSDFTVTDSNCRASLNWQLANGANTERFDIELSADGVNFQTAGAVNAINTNQETAYHFYLNTQTPGNWYYRLKIIGKNGNYNYSATKQLVIGCPTSFEVSISPNPVIGNSSIRITLPVAETAILRLYNAGGALVWQTKQILNAGVNYVPLQMMQSLAKGVYVLKVEAGFNKTTKQIIKR